MPDADNQLFAGLAARLDDPTPLLVALGNDVLYAWRDNIYTSSHGTFVPITAATAREKLRGGYPLTPLIRTRHLLFSMNENVEDNVFQAGPETVTVGTSDPIARIQADGEPDNNLPARDFTVLWPEHVDRMRTTTAKYLAGEAVGL